MIRLKGLPMSKSLSELYAELHILSTQLDIAITESALRMNDDEKHDLIYFLMDEMEELAKKFKEKYKKKRKNEKSRIS